MSGSARDFPNFCRGFSGVEASRGTRCAAVYTARRPGPIGRRLLISSSQPLDLRFQRYDALRGRRGFMVAGQRVASTDGQFAWVKRFGDVITHRARRFRGRDFVDFIIAARQNISATR